MTDAEIEKLLDQPGFTEAVLRLIYQRQDDAEANLTASELPDYIPGRGFGFGWSTEGLERERRRMNRAAANSGRQAMSRWPAHLRSRSPADTTSPEVVVAKMVD